MHRIVPYTRLLTCSRDLSSATTQPLSVLCVTHVAPRDLFGLIAKVVPRYVLHYPVMGGRRGRCAPEKLAEADLLRELKHLHTTRHGTFLHGSPDALREHSSRTAQLEEEYLRRHPEREVDPARTRSGARGEDGNEDTRS